MGLKDSLTNEVRHTFNTGWQVQGTSKVPSPQDLLLNSNNAKDLESATVLYADLDGSTNMVDGYKWQFSAEIYKAFLRCCAAIIRDEGGVVTAYDGDRVMAVFTGDSKNTSAVRCGLKINYAVINIIRPAIAQQYTTTFLLKHVVGIDSSQLRTARIGVHGDNDLVWIGRAANYAAKLTDLSTSPTWITESVYSSLPEMMKTTNGASMWVPHTWNTMKGMRIYASNWTWAIS